MTMQGRRLTIADLRPRDEAAGARYSPVAAPVATPPNHPGGAKAARGASQGRHGRAAGQGRDAGPAGPTPRAVSGRIRRSAPTFGHWHSPANPRGARLRCGPALLRAQVLDAQPQIRSGHDRRAAPHWPRRQPSRGGHDDDARALHFMTMQLPDDPQSRPSAQEAAWREALQALQADAGAKVPKPT
jgi:hypothetical protein